MASVLYYLFLLVFTVPYFVLFCVLFLLTVLFDRERVVLHYASRIWALGIFKLNPCWKLKIEGRENVDSSGAWVVVSNHQSMADIPLLYVLPLTFKWVSKTGVKKWPLFGQVLLMHGDILIERGSGQSALTMLKKSREHLDKGTSIVMFPEGTRSKDGQIGRFKEGAFLLAKNTGTGILPVVIEGTGSMTNGWRISIPHTFRVHILKPVTAEETIRTEPKAMAEKVQTLMSAEHERMMYSHTGEIRS